MSILEPETQGSVGGLPPELLALLGSPALAGGAAGPSPAGGAPAGGGEQEPIAILKSMIEMAKRYIDVEPDQEDVATMTDVLNRLQRYLAKDQADHDGALGNPQTMRLLRKAG